MATIHVIDKNGKVEKGIPALTLLYEQTVSWRGAFRLEIHFRTFLC